MLDIWFCVNVGFESEFRVDAGVVCLVFGLECEMCVCCALFANCVWELVLSANDVQRGWF